jgi:tetratricopeptide (TPR) repeat protein
MEPKTAPDLFLNALDRVQGQPTQAALAQAALDCEKVLQEEPDHFWAQYLLAVCHLRMKHWADARAGLTICLNRDPSFSWARSLRALAHGQLEDYSRAEDDFEAVLRQTTDDPVAQAVALTNRGAMRVQQRLWDRAVADLRQARDLQPAVPEQHADLALALEGRRDRDAAVRELGRALALRPDALWYHTRGRLNVERHNLEAARADFEQAVQARTTAAGPVAAAVKASDYVELAHLHHLAGEHQAALRCCDEAQKVVPDYPPAYLQRADTLKALNQLALAGKALDRYLLAVKQAAPELNKVYQARGLIHAKLLESEQAVESYNRALAVQPAADTLTYRGWAYLQLDDAGLALADFAAALRLLDAAAPGLMSLEELRRQDVVRSDALCGRGQARVRLGHVREAVEDAEAALGLVTPGRDLLLSTACLYGRAVNAPAAPRPTTPDEALRYRERAVRLLWDVRAQVREGERKAFWQNNVKKNRDLAVLGGSPDFVKLARAYGQ